MSLPILSSISKNTRKKPHWSSEIPSSIPDFLCRILLCPIFTIIGLFLTFHSLVGHPTFVPSTKAKSKWKF
jgi:hypothetical protein